MTNELGKPPSRTKFIAHTGITEYQVLKNFPSWNDAIEAAGFMPNISNIKIKDDKLLEDWGELVRILRQIPTRNQYRYRGKYSPGTFESHFGPWSQIPDIFKKFATDKNEWNDILALLPVEASNAAIKRLDKKPQFAGRKSSLSTPKQNSKLNDRAVYGEHIDFRGLRHEPVNEKGVIFLFSIVARELGYSVEAVQADFPDCEAKRQIAPGRWQQVQIEFEFESRNFRDHGHAPNLCDVIVCWRHNWSECPNHIEIVELSKVIKRLGKSDE